MKFITKRAKLYFFYKNAFHEISKINSKITFFLKNTLSSKLKFIKLLKKTVELPFF